MRVVSPSRRPLRGFTLVEVMMVVVIMSLVAGFMLISTQSLGPQILEETSSVMAADLMLARDTAFTYGTEFTVSFDITGNTYTVSHTGSGQTPPFERPLGNGTMGNFTISVDGIHPGGNSLARVTIYRVRTTSTNQDVTNVVFNSLGNTGPSRTEDTCIWLSQGTGAETRYQKITINWMTGQIWTSQISSTL